MSVSLRRSPALAPGPPPLATNRESRGQQLAAVEKEIIAWGRASKTCRHLITAPGFGPILASAMAAMVADPRQFRSGRDFAASLGLVPRQEGTGGKVRLGPISKRGNGYLRGVVVHGATAVVSSQPGRRHARA